MSLDTQTMPTSFLLISPDQFNKLVEDMSEMKALIANLKESDDREWIPIKEFCKRINISYSTYHNKRNGLFAGLRIHKPNKQRLFVHVSEVDNYYDKFSKEQK